MVTGEGGLRNRSHSVCVETSQQDRRLYLRGSHRRLIVNAVKLTAGNAQWHAAVSKNRYDIRTHHGQRCDNSLHRAGLQRRVADHRGSKRLRRQNTGDQTGGCTAVAAVKDRAGSFQSAHAVAVNHEAVASRLDIHAKLGKAGDRG